MRRTGNRRCTVAAGSVVWLLIVAVLASACAVTEQHLPPPAARPAVDTDGLRWHAARFRMDWLPDSDPQWYVDSLLAREVVAPVLDRYAGEIALWRFHRRARRDDTGHQFSFIFYATPDAAGRVLADVNDSAPLACLTAAGVVAAVTTGDLGGADQGRRLSATSDAGWSEAMQRAWPYFIDGVSRLWLTLIQEAAAALGDNGVPDDMDDWLARYRSIDAAVTATWQAEGRHALLHHLNAIFGYEPIPVVERRMLRF